ncbi:VIT domain-containing protein [Bailinhaonella thermotolerans]|uniref:VWA domain-containing protein n=1 Tax=Bailinhaonella thermotolerans TaxID=1070861 RepID=A0A3A4BJI3_9ACTN|nr:VIT domain-containing protein [Bailinhaonella thermotolerans]RJL31402.1 VWA domain-containing protein [Bailinhaonella thermotolerans]
MIIAPLPETPPLPDAGLGALATERGNLPLDSVDVHAVITGPAAAVTVTQGFRNPFDQPLEATYVFPLPARAAVTAMRMEAADHTVEGVLKERAEARAEYDAAIAAGHRAAIAEEDRPDVFTMRVGNIAPGERVTVRLALTQPLPYEDGAATFRFPLVVAPRYVPGAPIDVTPSGQGVEPDTDAVPDASRVTPPTLLPGFPNPVRLSLTAELAPGCPPYDRIESALHVVARDERTISLQPGERLDRDFVLRLRAAPGATTLTLTPDAEDAGGREGGDRADGPGEGTFTLTLMPPAGETAGRERDVVLVLDRSGSMAGWKIVAARRAAARIVDTLTERDRFAVLAFDHQVEAAHDGLVAGSDRNRFRAVEHLARLEARGGTEMVAPLERAVALLSGGAAPGSGGRDAVLVLVTDGQVANEDQILRRIPLAGVRVHTVGIDRAVNAGFLGRLAMLGRGRCELVESEERLDEAMEHIHRRIGSPALTDVQLAAGGFEVVEGTVTGGRDLFPGVPLVIRGRWRGAAGGTPAVRAVTPDGEPWERPVEARAADDPAAAVLWARARVRDLEDAYATGRHELRDEIVATSLRYGVLCRFTAFVAVDSRATGAEGSPHRVIQPVELPSGWEMPAPAAPGARGFAAEAAAFTAGTFAGGATLPRSLSVPPESPPLAGGPGTAAGPFPARRAAAEAPAAKRRAMPPGSRPVGAEVVREVLREELARLHDLETAPPAERRSHLSDLVTRLGAFLRDWWPADEETAEILRDLESALPRLDPAAPSADRSATDLATRWAHAVQVLEAHLTPGRPGPAPDAPREFWT